MMKTTLALLTMAAAAFAQGLPDGKGKELVATQCAACHGIDQVTAHRDTKEGWDGLVAYMVSRGMAASNDEVKTMVDYLANAFPPAPKPVAGKSK